MHSDPYTILGVAKTASQEEIRRAYRKKSLELHPDKNRGDEESTKRFQELSDAYRKLDTPEKKSQYDRTPTRLFTEELGIDVETFFKNFMQHANNEMPHTGMPRPGMPQFFFAQSLQRPTPIIKTLEISMHQAYTGGTIPIVITRWVMQNNVKVDEEETIYVDIPSGIDNNEIVICKEKGNVLASDNVGDVKVFIKILNDTLFLRDGINLIYRKTITLKEALCGFKTEMTHLNGKTFLINSTDGSVISPTRKRTVHGLGMKRGSHIGDLFIEFDIVFPEKLSLDIIKQLGTVLPNE
jgi:DnaJ-class molecular chaperone